MINFVLGTIFGIVVATVGFAGVAQWADTGVNKVKKITREAAR